MLRSLQEAREACKRAHPGLLQKVEQLPFMEREVEGSSVVEYFRAGGGPGLLVPRDFGGLQASSLEAVQVQRALAAASPSLGVATVMHHFTTALLFRLATVPDRLTPFQLEILKSIAKDNLILASGWAEGRTDQNILAPAVVAKATAEGFTVNGSKKPCSLSQSMDILTTSVAVPQEGSERTSLGLLLIPANSPGISVEPFWATPILAGTQSHEVRLNDVKVSPKLLIPSTPVGEGGLDDLQTSGFTWFELLTTAAYIGVASRLVDRVYESGRGSVSDRADLGIWIQAAVDLVEGTARAIDQGDLDGDSAVAAVLVARYACQPILRKVAMTSVGLLGGISFILSPEISYLESAVHALAFHPPSQASAAGGLADYFAGGPLELS